MTDPIQNRYYRIGYWEPIKRNGLEVRRPLPFYLLHVRGFGKPALEPAPVLATRDVQSAQGYIPEVHEWRVWNKGEMQHLSCRAMPDNRPMLLHDYSDCKFPYA